MSDIGVAMYLDAARDLLLSLLQAQNFGRLILFIFVKINCGRKILPDSGRSHAQLVVQSSVIKIWHIHIWGVFMLILHSMFQHSIMLMFIIVCCYYMVVVCFSPIQVHVAARSWISLW